VPLFYARNARGIPHGWIERMRASVSRLAPMFSSNRMLQEYLGGLYRPAAAAFRRRSEDRGKLAKELRAWHAKVSERWHEIHFGELEVERRDDEWHFGVPVYFGETSPEWARVELYADPGPDLQPLRQSMARASSIPGAMNGYVYRASVPASRPCRHFTPRVMANHPEAFTPIETGLITWYR